MGMKIKPVIKTNDAEIYLGNSLEVLKQFDDESVDCVITSSPYWSKRWYCDEFGEETIAVNTTG